MLFSEPKIPQWSARSALGSQPGSVSVLFSEPKIPQCRPLLAPKRVGGGFSALQRAENSSMTRFCSTRLRNSCFSALQRAENSSIFAENPANFPLEFQCSSASRKFLNPLCSSRRVHQARFQCSSASRKFLNRRIGSTLYCRVHVSVLFSEPKIPQSRAAKRLTRRPARFSALQRAENSSIA